MKNKGFGHLKTRLFTIKASKHVGFMVTKPNKFRFAFRPKNLEDRLLGRRLYFGSGQSWRCRFEIGDLGVKSEISEISGGFVFFFGRIYPLSRNDI